MRVTRGLWVAAVVFWAAGAVAQTKVDERRPMKADGTVSIENIAGSVQVVGSPEAELKVTGTLGKDVEKLDIQGTETHMRVIVRPKAEAEDAHADLVIKVPAGSRVEVHAVSADVSVADVKGAAEVKSVSGKVAITGQPREVQVETVSGAMDVSAATGRVEAKSVSGLVLVKGARGELAASTVSGKVDAGGTVFDRVKIETVSGAVRFEGELPAKGRLDVKSMSGGVTLVLPKGMGAELALSSFSGSIDVAGQPAGSEKKSIPGLPGRKVQRTLGDGGARVTVDAFSGDVTIVHRP